MEYHLESYTMLLLKQEVHEYPHCLIVSHSSRRLAVLIIVLIKRKEADLTECGARLLLDYSGWSCLWACFVWSVAYEKVITVSLAAETHWVSLPPFPYPVSRRPLEQQPVPWHSSDGASRSRTNALSLLPRGHCFRLKSDIKKSSFGQEKGDFFCSLSGVQTG